MPVVHEIDDSKVQRLQIVLQTVRLAQCDDLHPCPSRRSRPASHDHGGLPVPSRFPTLASASSYSNDDITAASSGALRSSKMPWVIACANTRSRSV